MKIGKIAVMPGDGDVGQGVIPQGLGVLECLRQALRIIPVTDTLGT